MIFLNKKINIIVCDDVRDICEYVAVMCAETDDVEQNARKKLAAKNFDWIAANRVGIPGSGFGSDTNILKLYAADGSMTDLGSALKTRLADQLIRIFTAGKEGNI